MTSDPAGKPARANAAPAASPDAWDVRVSRDQDRWALILPETTRRDRYVLRYQGEHGSVPGTGWMPPELPDYVAVSATMSSGRVRHSVLMPALATGSAAAWATVSTDAFGTDVTSVTLKPARRWRFRLARLSTTANLLKIASVALGTASAVITAILDISARTLPLGSALTGAGLIWSILAAAFALAAPLLALAGGSWFS